VILLIFGEQLSFKGLYVCGPVGIATFDFESSNIEEQLLNSDDGWQIKKIIFLHAMTKYGSLGAKRV
jgi:hypothetical protein